MGASHSRDHTVFVARVRSTYFALVPLGLVQSPDDPIFIDLYNRYNPQADAASPPPRVLEFFCGTAPRKTRQEYYRILVEAAKAVDPAVKLPMPVMVLTLDRKTGDEWQASGYIGARTFGQTGDAHTTAVLGTWLDSSPSRRSWSLLVMRMACRMFKACCREQHDCCPAWPVRLQFGVQARNIACLRAVLNVARYADLLDREQRPCLAEEQDGPEDDAPSRDQHDTSSDSGRSDATDGSAPRSDGHTSLYRAMTEGPGSALAQALAPVAARRRAESTALLDSAGLAELRTHVAAQGVSAVTGATMAFEQHLVAIRNDAALRRGADLLADTIGEVAAVEELPHGLGALLPAWDPATCRALAPTRPLQFNDRGVETLAALDPDDPAVPRYLAELQLLVDAASAAKP